MRNIQFTFALNFIKVVIQLRQLMQAHNHKSTMCKFLVAIPVICIRYFAHTPYTAFVMFVATYKVLEDEWRSTGVSKKIKSTQQMVIF